MLIPKGGKARLIITCDAIKNILLSDAKLQINAWIFGEE